MAFPADGGAVEPTAHRLPPSREFGRYGATVEKFPGAGAAGLGVPPRRRWWGVGLLVNRFVVAARQ